MTSIEWRIRRVHPEVDASLWREIRLEGLREAPYAFASHIDEWKDRPLRDFAAWLNRATHFVAVADGRAVGTIAWTQVGASAGRHRGQVVGVYVRREGRGLGIGDALLASVARHASKHVLQLELGVAGDNAPAIALYKRNGYEEFGRLPRGYRHGDGFRDEVQMLRRLDA